MTDTKTEKAMRAWYIGLPCRKCGVLVKQNDGGIFVRPYCKDCEPYAECQKCRETK